MLGDGGRALVLVTLLLGCASRTAAPPPGDDPFAGGPGERPLLLPQDQAATATCPEMKGSNAIARAAVVRVVDRGLGAWLGGVAVAPVREGGRFRGWRIDRLHPDDACYQQIDLRPGDVVTRINGASLEKPEQANQVFQALRSARRLDIERLREGTPATVSLEIVD